MRGVVLLAAALLGCGRLGFDAKQRGDDGGTDSVDPTGDQNTTPRWDHISAGDETVCGISAGHAYCWGRGTNNEIGDGNATNRNAPTEVALPAGTVTDIVQGEGHGCAVVDGKAYCWGLAAIGNGTPTSATPVAVTLPTGVTSISAGGGFACAVLSTNLYCWGNDPQGALGNGAGGPTMTPQQVFFGAEPMRVVAGNDHTMALLADGTVQVWGHNDNGVFGAMNPASSQSPVLMTAVTGVLPVLAGWHACALKNGGVTCWGMGSHGELGDNNATDSATPVSPANMTVAVSLLATGGGPSNFDTTCAAIAGLMSCWGSNAYGRVGANGTSNAVVPFAVQGVPNDVVEIAMAFETTCERSSNGVVRCWGRGDLGQLGDGRGIDSLTPVVVPIP